MYVPHTGTCEVMYMYAFGNVVEGMEYVTQIGELECDEDDKPVVSVLIKDCGVY